MAHGNLRCFYRSNSFRRVVLPMVRSQRSFSSTQNTKEQYVCVECGAPCNALYYQLSASSIKALTCSNCGQIADPYIEQEWLLIAIDCILFRVEAYRHVLFNADEVKLFSTRKLIVCGLVWSILDSYLKWETHRINQDDRVVDPLLYSTLFICFLIASSFLGMILEFLTILFYMKSKWNKEESTSLMPQKLFLALLLPSSFVVITILVLMWEKTRTVLLLGSLMTACWKAVAVSIVSCDFWAPCIGLVVRLIWHILQKPAPCTGLEVVLESWSLKLCFP